MKQILTPEQHNEFLKEIQKPYWGQLRYLAGKYGVKEGTLRQIKSRHNKQQKKTHIM